MHTNIVRTTIEHRGPATATDLGERGEGAARPTQGICNTHVYMCVCMYVWPISTAFRRPPRPFPNSSGGNDTSDSSSFIQKEKRPQRQPKLTRARKRSGRGRSECIHLQWAASRGPAFGSERESGCVHIRPSVNWRRRDAHTGMYAPAVVVAAILYPS